MKKILLRLLPNKEHIRNSRIGKILGDSILDPTLWRIQRKPISKGTAVGLFWAFIPIPFQMAFATATSLLIRCNIPVSLTMCWATNPFTIPFFFFFNYRIGLILTFSEPIEINKFTDYKQIFSLIQSIWLPLWVGSVVVAIVASTIGYFTINNIWRVTIMRRRSKRIKCMEFKHVKKSKPKD